MAQCPPLASNENNLMISRIMAVQMSRLSLNLLFPSLWQSGLGILSEVHNAYGYTLYIWEWKQHMQFSLTGW